MSKKSVCLPRAREGFLIYAHTALLNIAIHAYTPLLVGERPR